MSILDPSNCTIGDIVTAILEECGRLGSGQTAVKSDMTKVWARVQMMLQQWQRKRWLVYHLVTYSIVATGQTSYTFGPGGEINTNTVSAWGLTSIAPLSGQGGMGYGIGDLITLNPTLASGTPSAPQVVQVSAASGGAVTALSLNPAATGSFLFSANAAPGQSITLGGASWTFVNAITGVQQTLIQATAELTLAQLVSDLSASGNSTIQQCSYGTTGAIATNNLLLRMLFKVNGNVGDTFTLASSSANATPSGATLTGGSFNTVTWPGPLPNTWTQLSTNGQGFNMVAGFPTWTKANRQAVVKGSQRPAKLESAFLRQIQISQPNQVDYWMDILQSHEDYDKIALKQLQSFPGCVFLDSDWPLGNLFCYPVPQASIYSINLTVREQLQTQFATLSTPINLPQEYYSAILYNGAIRAHQVFQIPIAPDAPLLGLAKDALNVLRGPNTQIARSKMPKELTRPGLYNIFSDQNY